MKPAYHFQVVPFNGRNPGQFYIQAEGSRAGQPLQQPVANCFSVFTDCPQAYDVAACLFEADAYAYSGKAFPVLTVATITTVLGEALCLPFCPRGLDTLRVALYEAAHAREVAEEWMQYARQFARNLYNSARSREDSRVTA
jgi:hypothetical protein